MFKLNFKLLFILCSLLFTLYSLTYAQTWEWQNPLPQGNNLNDVKCFGDTCIAVGNGGTIMKSTDGGLNWIRKTSGTTQNLVSLYFVNENVGYVVGNDTTALKTTNGGETWNKLILGIQYIVGYIGLNKVFFVDADTGYVIANNAYLIKTTDGGDSWAIIGEFYYIYSMFFVNANTGYLVGANYNWPYGFPYQFITKTTDGGSTWTTKREWNAPGELVDVFFTDVDTGYAIGGGIMTKTTDGGTTWVDSYSYFNFTNILFIDSNTGYVVGWYGTILKTTDAGNNWNIQSSGTTYHLYGVSFPKTNTGYIVGEYGAILKTTDGENWTHLSSRIYSNESYLTFNSVYFVNANTGFAVGYGYNRYENYGAIFKTTNGGTDWDSLSSGTSYTLTDVYFINENTGWIVGNTNGTILKTTDGGATFLDKSVGNWLNLTSVFFLDKNVGYATQDYGMVLKTVDGGENWVGQTGPGGYVYDSFFLDINTGYVVGWGIIGKTTDGGNSWVRQDLGVIFRDVFFASNNIGYAVGDGGNIYKTTDAGTNWNSQESGTAYNLMGVHFLDENTGYVVGNNGLTLTTTDGGDTWINQTEKSSFNLNKVFFPNTNNGYAVGNGGTILKYTNNLSIPSAPTNLTATPSKAQHNIMLNWQDVTNETYYTIYRFNVPIADIPVNTINYFDNVSREGSYSYRVRAKNDFGASDFSNWADISFTDAIAPTVTVISPNGGEFWGVDRTHKIKWSITDNSLIGAVEVSIYYQTKSNTEWTLVEPYPYNWVNPLRTDLTAVDSVEWLIPDSITSSARIKIFVKDSAGNVGVDSSDNTFTITNWDKQISGTSNDIEGIFFVDCCNIAWAVGDSGTMLFTNDGGNNWYILARRTDYRLYTPYFIDYNTGYIVGQHGTILKTTDSGYNWIFQDSQTSNDLFTIQFLNTTTGYAVGDNKTILKTNNGGINWTIQKNNPGIFYSVYFLNLDTGYVSGGQGAIFKTTNGGTVWDSLSSGTTEDLFGVFFVNADTGYAVGTNGKIIKTTNGGALWSSQTSGTFNTLYRVFFLDENTGYAVGDAGTIVKTTNGGLNWNKLESGVNTWLGGVYFINGNIGYAVGEDGTILKYIDTMPIPGYPYYLSAVNLGERKIQLNWTDNSIDETGFTIYRFNTPIAKLPPNSTTYFDSVSTGGNYRYRVVAFNDSGVSFSSNIAYIDVGWNKQTSGVASELRNIFFVNINTGYAVGVNSTVLKTVNGGIDWSSLTLGHSADVLNIFFMDVYTGYVSGTNGLILKTTNGGTDWTDLSTGANDWKCITFLDSNTGYIAGNNGAIQKTTNAGTNWNDLTTGTNNNINSIYFLDLDIGYAVGSSGVILKTTNGGINWTPRGSFTNDLNSIVFTDKHIGYIAGNNGTILKTTDGGDTWNSQPSGTTNNLDGIFFLDSNNGYAVGYNGTVLMTNDGGESWSLQVSGTVEYLHSIFFVDTNIGYIAGANGTILKYSNAWQLPYTPYNLIAMPVIVNGKHCASLYWYGGDENIVYRFNTPIDTIMWSTSGYIDTVSVEGNYNYRIRAVNNNGVSAFSNWANAFVDFTLPNVTLVQPNGGETWKAESWQDIIWNATDNRTIKSVAIYYQITTGENWTRIDSIFTTFTNPDTFNWQIPDTSATQARVKIVCYDETGNSAFDISDNVFTISKTVSVESNIHKSRLIPETFALGQNYPNPFNPETVISYQLAVVSNQLSGNQVSSKTTDYRLPITNYQLQYVKLSIYSITGQLVRTLVNEEQSPGYYSVKWDGKDNNGYDVAGGVYIYQLNVRLGNSKLFSQTKKLVMVK